MKKTSKTILFFGNERLATGVKTDAPVLQALIDNGYEVRAVVIAQSEIGPSRKDRKLEIQEVAEKHSIPVLIIDNLNDDLDKIQSLGCEVGVLVAYGKIVPESVITAFPRGIINIHPSLLPLHRGPTPIESVILNGERETGVSLMRLVKELDAGPVIDQIRISLAGNESKQELANKCAEAGAQLVIKNLPAVIDGTAKAFDQDDAKATYDEQIQKSDGEIDWTQSASVIARQIRAYTGWPRSRTAINDRDIVITEAAVTDGQGKPRKAYKSGTDLAIYCGQKSLLIKKLVPAGKKEMTGQAFLAGYKI